MTFIEKHSSEKLKANNGLGTFCTDPYKSVS